MGCVPGGWKANEAGVLVPDGIGLSWSPVPGDIFKLKAADTVLLDIVRDVSIRGNGYDGVGVGSVGCLIRGADIAPALENGRTTSPPALNAFVAVADEATSSASGGPGGELDGETVVA